MIRNGINKKVRHKKASKIGLSPGSLVYVGEDREGDTTIHCTRYDKAQVETFHLDSAEKMKKEIKPEMINWFNITGIHNTGVIEQIGNQFDIHPLLIEDILNTDHRPKIEIYDSCLFVSLKVLFTEIPEHTMPRAQQISLLLAKDYLLTFQEIDADYFKSIRKRIDREDSRIRSNKTDYLFYAMIDLVVDHYLLLIEHKGDDIQSLEDKIYDQPEKNHLHMVMTNKRNLLYLRRIILPLQESMQTIKGIKTDLIDPRTRIFFGDVHDHISTVMDTLDLYFELNTSLRDSYMSSIGIKTNEIVNLLTVISTIFIPLTFIVGVYGMNFEYLPELTYRYGYFYTWMVMIAIAVFFIIFFKRKKWL